METENTYQFRNVNGQLLIVSEKNTKITYTITRQHRLFKLVVTYTRVQIVRTARARVVYFIHNNRIARIKRAAVPAVRSKLAEIGISVSVAQ